MKIKLIMVLTLILTLIISFSLSAKLTSPVGYWKTIDDESGEKKSIVKIWEKDKTLYGKIIKLFREPDEEQNPVCAKGSGDLTGKPMIGSTILRGLKKEKDSGWWIDGLITDPKKGKTYHCKIRLINQGKKLRVRGYIKVLIRIGRSQYWLRTENPNKKLKSEETPKKLKPKKSN